ncbi:glycosyltransferase family 2 protein [Aerosakkonema funiforme]|uniref:glycosyltransferase family 2 protein n=1 Tax=Aerosakkonema funiforme TaxID=1246630 RepID=UPI0035B6C75A
MSADNHPKVSVVIPAYNAMRYLPATLDSVFNQTYTDFEILIIDDGSKDETVEWVAQITDPRVKLISQQNKGVSEARNAGIANARGEYIALLDADDLWEPTKLEKQVRCLEDNPAVGLVYTWVKYADEEGNPTEKVQTAYVDGDVLKHILQSNILCCSSTPMVRRSCFEDVGVFDSKLSGVADWDMWIRIASRYLFGLIKEPLVRYRQHPNNMSNNCQAMLLDFRKVIERSFASVPSNLQYLKNRAYGHAYLYMAWKYLFHKDLKNAIDLNRQAIAHYPQLFFSKSYIRQSLILAAMRRFGPQGYTKMRDSLKQLISNKQPSLGNN